MNKKGLVEAIFKNYDVSHHDAKLAVNLVIETLSRAIASGKGVEIRGFGSFQRKYRSAYLGIHPKTAKRIIIAKRFVPFFKSGKHLKKLINE